MPNELLFNNEGRAKMKAGVDKLAKAVGATLGPKGRNVVIERTYSTPYITKDGVTVARSIELPDNIENMGAQMVVEVATKTALDAGDGTTTATVLAQAMIEEGVKAVAAGINPMDIKKGMDKGVEAAVAYIKSISVEVGDDNDKIKNIATISANGDKEIGGLIAEAMANVGNDGIISLENSNTSDTYIKTMDGMQFPRGYISTYFINNHKAQSAEYKNPYILVTDKKISTFKQVFDLLNQVATENASILIIAEEVDGEALSAIAINVAQNNRPFVCVKAPGFGELRQEMLKDICAVTGASFFTDGSGKKLETAKLADLGKCDSIIVTKDTTTLIGGAGKADAIKARVDAIDAVIDDLTLTGDKEQLLLRKAQINGSAAKMYVGATTEIAMKEKMDRIDDALHATKAAVKEGIVPGGGVTYIRAIKVVNDLFAATDSVGERTGMQIIYKALEAPLRQIVMNAGADSADIISEVKKMTKDMGYDAREEKLHVDMIQTGIIDPTKVSRVALENASSVAGLFLTTECIVSNIVEKNNPNNKTGS